MPRTSTYLASLSPSLIRSLFTRSGLAVLAGLLGACQNALLETELPLTLADQSVLVSIASTDAPLQLQAYAVQDGQIASPWTLSYDSDRRFTLHTLTYEASLEQLNLPPGPVAIATPDNLQRPLPSPDRIFQNVLENDTLSGWQFQNELTPPLSEVSLPITCTSFRVDEYPLPGGITATVMLPSDGRILMGNLNGELYHVLTDGRFQLLDAQGQFYDGYVQDDGTMYLGGPEGRLARAQWVSGQASELNLVDEAPLPTTADIWYLDGDPRPDRTEHFALVSGASDTTNTSVLYFQLGAGGPSGTWTTVFTETAPARELTWLRPGAMRAVFRDQLSLIGYENGMRVSHTIPENSIAGGITSVARIPNAQPLAGTKAGQIYRERAEAPFDSWAFLAENPPSTGQVLAIHSYVGGFILVRPFGITQVIGDRFCLNTASITNAEIGVDFKTPAPEGGRPELTLLNGDVIVQGTRMVNGQPQPRLFWFRASGI